MSVTTINHRDVATKIERGEATVVEALPHSYWQDGHLPTAVNLPHDADDPSILVTLPDHSPP